MTSNGRLGDASHQLLRRAGQPGGMTCADAAAVFDEMGLSRNGIGARLENLRASGYIVRVRDGIYATPAVAASLLPRDRAPAAIYPPEFVQALIQAATEWSPDTRIQRIDALTDELVKRGLCRPRHSDSMFESVAQELHARGLAA